MLDAREHCDDGNRFDGDECPATCHFGRAGLLIRGNQRPPAAKDSGCLVEWQLQTALLRRDRFAMPGFQQECGDQDPACDFDPTPGRCELRVRVCRDSRDIHLPECGESSATILEVLAPRAVDAQRIGNRAALLDALVGLPSVADVCTTPIRIRIDLGPRTLAREELLIRSAPTPRAMRQLSRLRLTCRRGDN